MNISEINWILLCDEREERKKLNVKSLRIVYYSVICTVSNLKITDSTEQSSRNKAVDRTSPLNNIIMAIGI